MESRTCTALLLFAAVLLHASTSMAAREQKVTFQFSKGPKPGNPVPQQPAGAVPEKKPATLNVNLGFSKGPGAVPQQPAGAVPEKKPAALNVNMGFSKGPNAVPQQPAGAVPQKKPTTLNVNLGFSKGPGAVPQQPAQPAQPAQPQKPAVLTMNLQKGFPKAPGAVSQQPGAAAPQKPAGIKVTPKKDSKGPGAVPQQPAVPVPQNPTTVVVNKEAPKPAGHQQPAVVIMNKDAAAAATVVLKNEPARPHADPKFGIPISHSWCIPKPTLTVAQLEANIKEICAEKRINCGPIDAGRECFDNNNVWTRASFAMNSHFRLLGRCDFNQTGAVSLTNPTFGACKFL